jgi:hypothetical protein
MTTEVLERLVKEAEGSAEEEDEEDVESAEEEDEEDVESAEEEDEEDVEKVGEDPEGTSAGTAVTASSKPKHTVTIDVGEESYADLRFKIQNQPWRIPRRNIQWRALSPSDDECRANLRRHQSLPPFGRPRDKS